jgi:hypothetical protein
MNRTEDERFKEDRAVFESADIGSLMEELKEKQAWTWQDFADNFAVSMYAALRAGGMNLIQFRFLSLGSYEIRSIELSLFVLNWPGIGS